MMNALPHYSHNCELVWMFQSPEVFLKECNMYMPDKNVDVFQMHYLITIPTTMYHLVITRSILSK